MASLIEDYEQQYAIITAEITAKISLLSSQTHGDRRKLIHEVDKHMEEAQELLEQMDLEVREVEAPVRPKYRTRVDSYRAELGRLGQEFVKARNSQHNVDGSPSRGDQFGEGFSLRDEQKQRLLSNSERIERTGNELKTGYRIILETEDIGASVLRDLQSQRETIQTSRNRLRVTDADLSRSTRTLNSMLMRAVQNRVVLYGVGAVFIIVIILSIYFSISK